MKKLINTLRKEEKDIDDNIFKSLENINAHCILGYRKNGVKHSFLEEYDKRN